MPFDPSKPVQTRDGRPAKIIYTEWKGRGGKFPILALIGHGEQAHYFTTEGRPHLSGYAGEVAPESWPDCLINTPDPAATPTPQTAAPFDPSKPCRTRGGQAVRILATDFRGPQPIVAACSWTVAGEISTDVETIRCYYSGGKYSPNPNNPSDYDLTNIPEQHSYWVNFHKQGASGYFNTKEEALACAKTMWPKTNTLLACLEITFEEGQGLTPPDAPAQKDPA